MNANNLSNAGQSVLHQASVVLDQVEALTHRGVEAVREGVHDGVQQVRSKAHNLGDHAVSYIKDEPVKSVLIAAAAGATLMGLLSLMIRGAGRG